MRLGGRWTRLRRRWTFPALGPEPLGAVFIRAPYVVEAGPDVDVLARHDGKIVFVRQGTLLGSAFHPEITGDRRVHELFLSVVAASAGTE